MRALSRSCTCNAACGDSNAPAHRTPAIYKQINIRKKSKNIPKKQSQKNAIIGFSFLMITYIILSLTVQKRKTSRISSVYAGFETFFIVNRYAYVAPSFWKNRMKGARARLSLIPGAEFSTRAYLSYKRLSYFFVCLHMFLIFAIGINSFVVSNPKAWCRESVSSLRL